MSPAKLISYTALRRQLGEALRPMRSPIYWGKAPEPVEFMGYQFTGGRVWKAPGQTGYAWTYDFHGEPCTDATRARWPTQSSGHIGGEVSACATQLHARLRAEFNEQPQE